MARNTLMAAAATLAMVGLTVPAAAQDGFYVGGFAQYVWADLGATETEENGLPVAAASSVSYSIDADRAGAGLVVGYDIPVGGGFFVGVEGSYAAVGAEADYEVMVAPGAVGFYRLEDEIMVRGRFGYAFGHAMAAYVTLGYARMDVTHGGTATTGPVEIDYTADGFTVGAGGRFKLTEGLSAFAEYVYTDYDDGDFNLHGRDHKVDLETNAIRIGLAFHLGN